MDLNATDKKEVFRYNIIILKYTVMPCRGLHELKLDFCVGIILIPEIILNFDIKLIFIGLT